MDAERLLEGLDAEQRLAVASPSLLLAVIAGAGSGKTSVLTRRIAYRIANDTADARHVAAVTFTRQAAGELRRRLARLGVREQVIAGTFHATALTMLRQHWDDTGRSAPSIVADRRRILAAAIATDARSPRVRDTAMEIDWARARAISPASYADLAPSFGRRPSLGTSAVADAMERYEAEKRRRGVIDLDDLLSMALELMRGNAAFAAAVRWRMRHVFVDEAQDLNPLQAQLLDEWRRGRDDVTLVGDPQQSIYGFNGADPSLLVAPEVRFPGIEVVQLTTNYRCTPEIVAAGVRVLAENGVEVGLRSARDEGRPVEVVGFADEDAEAAGIAGIVRERRLPGGSWRAIAVLARTNAQLLTLADSLRQAGIPCRLSTAARATTPIERALRDASESPSAHRLATWAIDATQTSVGDASNLDDNDVNALHRVAAAVEEFLSSGGGDGAAFLSWVRTTDPLRDADDSTDGVELLTFHAAKGREWRYVVVAGAEEGLVPHRTIASGPLAEEEIRLAYVAFTRASDALTVTWTERRGPRRTGPSRLLEGLPTTDSSVTDADGAPHAAQKIRSRTAHADPDAAVRTALTAWRRDLARATEQHPSTICSDADLERLVRLRPGDVDALAAILPAPVARRLAPRLLPILAR